MLNRKTAEIDSLVDGIDTFINPTQISDGATPDCLNVEPTGKGAIKTRQGRTVHGGEVSAGYGGQGYFAYTKSDNTIEELCVSNGVLYKLSSGTWGAVTGGTFSTTKRVYGSQIGDRLYFADGVTALCYYNGTSISTTGIASAPLPSFLITYNRRIYCNDVNNPDRVYFGGAMIADGTVANTGNFASTTPAFGGYLGFGRGRTVTGLSKLGALHLIIGLKDGIHRIYPVVDSGTSTALSHSEELVSNSIGIANHGTIDSIENDLGFLSFGDVYLLGEVASYSSLRTRVISTKVSSLIQRITATNISKCTAIYSYRRKKYYLAYPDGTAYNNKVLVYDTYYKSWWLYDSWNPAAWLEVVDSTDNYYLYYISDNSADSYSYEVNSGANDDDTAISWHWKSKVFDLKGFDLLKKFKRWATLFGPVFGEITVTIYIDDVPNTAGLTIGNSSDESSGLGSRILGTFVLGLETNDSGTADVISNDWRWKKLSRPNEGTKIQFKFSGGALNESGQIEKIKIYYNENERKKDRSKRIS